ncbi:MAG: hypothetical protein Q9211_004443 [Gyalolechia sp. 1 TL-2023]
MAGVPMICTGFSPQVQPVGEFAEGLFPCLYCIQPTSEDEYVSQVLEKGLQWLSANYPIQGYRVLPPDERLMIFRRWCVVVTPELINVIHGVAFWRLPYSAGSGQSRYITEGVSILMVDLCERFKIAAIGAEQNRGDIFMSSPLSPLEYDDLERGRFPFSLAVYGRPGPGVCGRPAERRKTSNHHPPADPFDRYGSYYSAYPSRGPGSSPQLEAPPRSLGVLPPRHQQQYSRPQQQRQRIRAPPRHFAPRSDSSSGSDSASNTVTDSSRRPSRGTVAKGKSQTKPKRRQRPPLGDDDDDDNPFVRGQANESIRGARRVHARKGNPQANPKALHRPPSDDDDDEDEDLFLGEDATRGTAARGKPKGKPSPRRRSPSEVFGEADEELELDADDGPPARRSAAQRPATQARRRGRSPSDDDEELPAMDAEEKQRLETLKAENGYGKGRG